SVRCEPLLFNFSLSHTPQQPSSTLFPYTTLFRSKPTYPEVVQIVLDIGNEDEIVMEGKDNKYIFTFSGENESIFEAFEDPYSLTLKRDITQNIKVIVDSETYFVEHMENALKLEDIMPGGIEEGELDVFIQQTYENFNEKEDITIPQEVMDEANE